MGLFRHRHLFSFAMKSSTAPVIFFALEFLLNTNGIIKYSLHTKLLSNAFLLQHLLLSF